MRCSVLAHYDVKPYVVLFLWDIDEEKRREEHQKLLNQKYELMEQLSLEYPFDLDVENWTMLRSYRLMELRGQYDYSEQYFPVDEEVLTLCPPDQELFLKAMKEAGTEFHEHLDCHLVSESMQAVPLPWCRLSPAYSRD